MRGDAVTIQVPRGISYIRQRFRMPCSFNAGVIAKQTVPRPRSGSATTNPPENALSPRSAHSTEAKKLFKSMQA